MLVPNKKKFVVGFLTALAVFFFFGSQIEAQVVINEVEFDSSQSGTDSQYEWVELYNLSDNEVILNGWIINDNSSSDPIPSTTLLPHSFLLLVANEESFRTNYPDFSGQLVVVEDGRIGSGLGNSADYLDIQGERQVEWEAAITPGHSLERSELGIGAFVEQDDPTPGSAWLSLIETSNPTSTLTPTNSPTPTQAEDEEPATCLVKSPTDSAGDTLTNVKIYVDGIYIHHYAPEELTFGPGRFCDQENKVACDFGKHKITLEKSGFESKSIEQEFYSGTEAEISLVLEKVTANSKPTSTSTPTSTPTIALATTSAGFISTRSGKVLGKEASESAFYPLGEKEVPSSSSGGEIDDEQPFWPWFVLGLGGTFLFSSGFLVYNRLK